MKSQLMNYSGFLIFLIISNLNQTNSCFRSIKSSSSNQMKDLNMISDENVISEKKLVLIDSDKTCNKSQQGEKNKEYLFCYHNGKCQTSLISVNDTHYQKRVFCICRPSFGGDNCRENYSFLEANFSIVSIAIIIGVVFVGIIIYLVYPKRAKKGLQSKATSSTPYSVNNTERVRGYIIGPPEKQSTDLLLADSKINNNTAHLNSPYSKQDQNYSRQLSSLSMKTGEIISKLNEKRRERI